MATGPTPNPLEAFLKDLETGGRIVAPGQFDLDRDLAVEALRTRQVADPWTFPVHLIQAAIARGAPGVTVQIDRVRIRVLSGGEPLERAALLDRHVSALSARTDPTTRALRHLAMGLGAAQATRPASITVATGELVLEIDAEGAERLVEGQPAQAGTLVTVEYGGLVRSVYDDLERVRCLLRERLVYAPVPVVLNDVDVARGLALPGSAMALAVSGDGFEGVCGSEPAQDAAQLRLVLDGAVVWLVDLPGGTPGTVVVVSHPGLRLDLSQAGVVRDERLDEVISAALDAAAALRGRIPDRRVELSVFRATPPARDGTRHAGGRLEAVPDPAFPTPHLVTEDTRAVRRLRLLKRVAAGWAAYCVGALVAQSTCLPAGDGGPALWLVMPAGLWLPLLLTYLIMKKPAVRGEQWFVRRATSPDAAPSFVGVTGTVRLPDPVEGNDRVVLTDSVWCNGWVAARLATHRPFALETPGGRLQVSLDAAPFLIAPLEPGQGGAALGDAVHEDLRRWLAARMDVPPGGSLAALVAAGAGASVAVGDEVEVVVARQDPDGLRCAAGDPPARVRVVRRRA